MQVLTCLSAHLLRIGIAVQTPVGVMSAGAILINCSVDLPARAMLMNMKQWNGICGCLYCEDEGSVVGSDHLHRYWPQQASSVQRSHAALLLNAEEATRTGTAVCTCIYLYMTITTYYC